MTPPHPHPAPTGSASEQADWISLTAVGREIATLERQLRTLRARRVRLVRRLYKAGYTTRALAKPGHLTSPAVSQIVRGIIGGKP